MMLTNWLRQLGLEADEQTCDVLVLGAGGAACRAALSARLEGADVLMLAKERPGLGGSTVHGASEMMGIGTSGFGHAADSPEIHYRDTMAAARGFIDPALVRVLAEDIPGRIQDLIDAGVRFDHAGEGASQGAQPSEERQFKLIRGDFASYARAMGVSGRTGKAIVTALMARCNAAGVRTHAPVGLVDVLKSDDGQCVGALCFDGASGRWLVVRAKAVILGTGGAHGLYSQQVSTNEMTGDGQAACWRAGADFVNMEFHQFGPALVHPYIQLFSKSCFILEPKLLNAAGRQFLYDYVPPGTSLSRVYKEKVFPFTISNDSRWIDIAMAREIAAGRGSPRGGVWFSFGHVSTDRMEASMPNTMRWMREHDVDPHSGLEVGIAFQCLNGGARILKPDGRTSVPGLYVIGELAGGLRGPDRPGGNSLAEGQVFGNRAGRAAASSAGGTAHPRDQVESESLVGRLAAALRPNANVDLQAMTSSLQRSMQANVLVEKNEAGLQETMKLVRAIRRELAEGGSGSTGQSVVRALALENMATTAQIILTACLARQESRSSHYRTDFPARNDATLRHSFGLRRVGDGEAVFPVNYPAD